MSDDVTEKITDKRSFEERVFARFDSIDIQFQDVNRRLETLEIESQRRSLETKPIWERALAEILEVKEGLGELRDETSNGLRDLSRKMGVLSNDMLQLKAGLAHAENRLDKLESKP